jgi:hypothetical protein
MKTFPVIFIVSLAVLIIACGKDKYETKPRIEIKDINTKDLFNGQDLRIRLNFYDKEGDLNGGTAYAIRQRLNLLPLGSSDFDKVDTFPNPNNPKALPDFPPTDFGEITFQLDWNTLIESAPPTSPGVVKNDTVLFRFVVTDKAGNTSDTINTDRIVLHN